MFQEDNVKAHWTPKDTSVKILFSAFNRKKAVMLIINKTLWRIVGLTLLFTGGWCVYFDQKRKKGGESDYPNVIVSMLTLTLKFYFSCVL